MEIKNIRVELQHASVDINANVKIIKLTGNSEISIFAAEILPKTELKPHYHKYGIEIYQILEGSGEMKVGKVNADSVQWDKSFRVEPGDCFTINEKQVHQLINNSNKPLKAVFTCPELHLSSDRYFITA